MRRVLKLPTFITIEYKKHEDSLLDKSSYRNCVVWRAPATTGRQQGQQGKLENKLKYHEIYPDDDEKMAMITGYDK